MNHDERGEDAFTTVAGIDKPQVVLDAGGETALSLSTALARCTHEMAGGQVLEVISMDPTARIDVMAWCRLTGHELLQMVGSGNESRFWIRKR
jgi:tRNA 2-thiouridine synthesizing protein A